MSRQIQVSITALAALLAIGTLFACGSDGNGDEGSGSGSLEVVATTTQIGDLVRNVAGDRIDLTQVMQPDTDPHVFEPRPSDVAAAAGAKLIFTNGQDLDAWAEQLVADSGGEGELIDLSASLPELEPGEAEGEHEHEHGDEDDHGHEDEHADEGEDGHEDEHGHDDHEAGHEHNSEFDPHWWHDPRNAMAAVEAIADRLAAVDPEGADVYRQNADSYVERIEDLDRQIETCVDRLPAAQRKLVTDHEAFGYFARRYGLEVIGAVIPAMTTEAQPSARDLSELAEEIEHEKVQAIFPESSLSPKLAQAIASQTGASADHMLYGDSLGPADSEGATYLEMMSANAEAIADGLSGGKVNCEIEIS